MIRYRRSLNYKQCRLWIKEYYMDDFFGTIREILSIRTPGGVWSQELKLKGIDGRAPPGVESAA